MELRHFRHFVAVAEELHFARAAERLGMEQSPLSHSIRNLETELGVRLFHRTTRRTWLTRAGARLLADARRILADIDAAVASARGGEAELPSRLRLGLAEHAAGEPFTRALFELEHRTPPIRIELREIAPGEAVRLILDHALDLAVVLEAHDAPGYRRTRAWGERLALVVPMGHVLAESDRASVQDLAKEHLFLPDASTSPGYAGQIEALLARLAVQPLSRATVKHQNTLVSLVSTGRGVGFLPEAIAQGLTSVAVLPLIEPDAEMVSWLLYREEDASDGVAFALEVAAAIDAGDVA